MDADTDACADTRTDTGAGTDNRVSIGDFRRSACGVDGDFGMTSRRLWENDLNNTIPLR